MQNLIGSQRSKILSAYYCLVLAPIYSSDRVLAFFHDKANISSTECPYFTSVFKSIIHYHKINAAYQFKIHNHHNHNKWSWKATDSENEVMAFVYINGNIMPKAIFYYPQTINTVKYIMTFCCFCDRVANHSAHSFWNHRLFEYQNCAPCFPTVLLLHML